MNVTVFGTGFVGLVAGACMADFGLNVHCVDIDERKIAQLNQGIMPIYEQGLEELVSRNVSQKRLHFTSDLESAVRNSLVLFIAVGTEGRPDGRANLEHVRNVAQLIGRCMEEYKVVVMKSTVPVGTAAVVAEWVREAQSKPIEFDVVSNPEFLREGAAIEDFMRPNRVVLGADNARALAIVKDIYRPLYLIETPFVTTDNRTAELIKYATNSFLAIKISYINEVARLCDRVGADVHVIAKAVGMDGRIGRKFLHPGPGYGGSCLPKDTRAFLRTFEDYGVPNHLVAASVRINDEQIGEVLRKLTDALGGLEGRTIGLLGLTYKPNTNDVRESPSLAIARALLQAGAQVVGFDPIAHCEAGAAVQHPNFKIAESALASAAGADAVVVGTEWNEFRNLDLAELKRRMTGSVLLDARNIYDPETVAALGFCYIGVGRATEAERNSRKLGMAFAARA